MIIKKIGTSQLPDDKDRPSAKRDETTSLETLRTSLGAGNTLSRGLLLENRYEVEQVIGYGGMSTVYRARDVRFTQTVRVCAVKEMFDVSTDPAVRQDKLKRFEEEANFLALLNHPAIPKIFDFFPANDRRYLVLEFIDGKNLETLLEEKQAPLEEVQVLEWAVVLCEVLSYLHNHKPKPIVFRDMKPSNVMQTSDNRLVLIDFGIAKTFQEDKKGTMIGTEGYSPPEQYRGLALPGGDIYALGATLHQLLTNSDPRVEIPFTFHERLPRGINPKISAETEALIMKCLEFDLAKRWANVEDLKNAMLRVLGRSGGGGGSATNRLPSTGGGVSTRDLSGKGNSTTLDNYNHQSIIDFRNAGISGHNPTMPIAVPNAPMRQPAAGQAGTPEVIGAPANLPMAELVWSFACEEEVRSSPTVANSMVYVGCYDSNLYALDSSNGGFLWKAATNGGVCTTPCIADRLVVVGSEDSTLYAFEKLKGQPVWTVRTNGPVRGSARYYAPMIFFGSDDQHIYCVEARTGKQVWKTRTWAPVRSTPTIIGGTVYIGGMDGHLYALDGNSGNIKWKFRALEGISSSPVVHDNVAYVGSLDSHVYAIDTTSSWALWKFKTEHEVRSSPVVVNGKVYVGSVDGRLYCIDAKSGKLTWKFHTGKQITSSPRVADGMVFFGGIEGNVYALDADKGTPRWYYPTEGAIPSSPAVDNGVVYIGSLDYRVYAISAR